MTEAQEIILNALRELCKKYPQQTLGQIIYKFIVAPCPNQDPFYVEDEQLLWIMEKEIAKNI